MRPFWSVVRLAIRQQLTYRTAIFAGLATNLFFGFLRAAVMGALYAGRGIVNQYSLSDAISFVGFSQALIAFLTMFGSMDLMQTIYTGDIAAALIRPADFHSYWMARDLGKSLVNLVGRGVLFMLIYRLFFAITLPGDWRAWAGLTAALGLAWLVSFEFRFCVSLAAFWTTDGLGINRFAMTVVNLMCGFIMPLALLPDWFSTICKYTPFPSMLNTPMDIYLGRTQGGDALLSLTVQAIWAAVLFGVAQLVMRLGFRKLVIQGG